jgi:hypothetical protein
MAHFEIQVVRDATEFMCLELSWPAVLNAHCVEFMCLEFELSTIAWNSCTLVLHACCLHELHCNGVFVNSCVSLEATITMLDEMLGKFGIIVGSGVTVGDYLTKRWGHKLAEYGKDSSIG